MGKNSLFSRKLSSIIIFLLPALTIYLIFVVYPTINALRISLFKWRGMSASKSFIGLANFAELIHDPIFFLALFNNLKIFAVILFIIPPIALFLGVMLSKKIRGANFYRSTFLFPSMMGDVAIATLWILIYAPSFGILNESLRVIGLGELTRGWLGEKSTALVAVTIPLVYKWIGFYVILFLGAILNIPRQLYEAATIDGAGGWQNFWYVTLPFLKQTIAVAMVFIIVNSFSTIFVFAQLMTMGGGPDRATEVIPSYLVKQAFEYSRFGYGSAIGFITLILMFSLSILFLRPLMKRSD